MIKQCFVGVIRTPSGWQQFAGCGRHSEGWQVVVRFGETFGPDIAQAQEYVRKTATPARADEIVETKRGQQVVSLAYVTSSLKEGCRQASAKAIRAARLVGPGNYTLEEVLEHIVSKDESALDPGIQKCDDRKRTKKDPEDKIGKKSLDNDIKNRTKTEDKLPGVEDADPKQPCSPNIKRWIAKWLQKKGYKSAVVKPKGLEVEVLVKDMVVKTHKDDLDKIEKISANGKTGLRFFMEEWVPPKDPKPSRKE